MKKQVLVDPVQEFITEHSKTSKFPTNIGDVECKIAELIKDDGTLAFSCLTYERTKVSELGSELDAAVQVLVNGIGTYSLLKEGHVVKFTGVWLYDDSSKELFRHMCSSLRARGLQVIT